MFRKGQLVRGVLSGWGYYIVITQRDTTLSAKQLGEENYGMLSAHYAKLIGNNYTAKDSKESAPANLGS